MTGSYDSFDEAAPVVARLYEIGNELRPVAADSPRWRELLAEVTGLFAEDVEHVTRDGRLRGPGRFFSDFRVQHERFEITFRDVELHDGGDCVVGIATLHRQMRDSPTDYLVNRGGTIYRVRDGKIVFFEGYPDGREALAAAGVEG